MESLRWILLVAGIIFVVALYILGRNRRLKNSSTAEDSYDDLPEFAAQSLDDVDASGDRLNISNKKEAVDSNDVLIDGFDADSGASATLHADTEESTGSGNNSGSNQPSDIIILYILAKPGQELLGSQINSSIQAMGLTFGEMDIYHYRPSNRNIFSIANMLEPGSFNAETIHAIKTSGLTVFMQISGSDPIDDLTEMLQRSYQLAGLLNARLCNSERKPLTEQDAENYRAQVRKIIDG